MFNPYDYYITPDEYEEAARNGVTARCVNWRIRNSGWSKKRAITTPIMERKDRSEIAAKAREHGIGYGCLMRRLYIGWDEERAATKPVRSAEEHSANAKRMSEMNRKYPLEILEIAKQNGIQYSTFTYRARAGWDMVRAATMKAAYSNGAMRVKEIHGENFLRENMKRLFLHRAHLKRKDPASNDAGSQ